MYYFPNKKNIYTGILKCSIQLLLLCVSKISTTCRVHEYIFTRRFSIVITPAFLQHFELSHKTQKNQKLLNNTKKVLSQHSTFAFQLGCRLTWMRTRTCQSLILFVNSSGTVCSCLIWFIYFIRLPQLQFFLSCRL